MALSYARGTPVPLSFAPGYLVKTLSLLPRYPGKTCPVAFEAASYSE